MSCICEVVTFYPLELPTDNMSIALVPFLGKLMVDNDMFFFHIMK